MKLIIAGSRSITDQAIIDDAVALCCIIPEDVDTVISGGASGVDSLGEMWAKRHGIPVIRCLPNYQLMGKSAPLYRNKHMAELGDFLVAVWDGKSSGTLHMARQMKRLGKPYMVVNNGQLVDL